MDSDHEDSQSGNLNTSHDVSEGYEYEAFSASNSIRLLRLFPGKADDPLESCLESFVMDRIPEYEAISYVWGDAIHAERIMVNRRGVYVTVNLYNALLAVRREHTTRLLWADAICINQQDDDEKGCQVGLMGTIFSRAKCVLAWLGLDEDGYAEEVFN